MHILVIGGSGFIGTRMTKLFREAGHKVSVLTRGQRPLPAGVEGIAGDRKNPAAFVPSMKGKKFDAVVDLQCYSAEDAQSAIDAFAGNIGHFIYLSTDFVYGGPNLPVIRTENCPRQAWGAYGQKKAQGEDAFEKAWREKKFPATWLRAPHILGSSSKLGTTAWKNRDPMLLDSLRKGAPVIVLDEGTFIIQGAYHHEIAETCLAAFGKPATFGQGYNMAGKEAITTRRYYEIVGEIMGCEVKFLSLSSALYIKATPKNIPFAQHRAYDMSKLKRDTGYAPPHTPRQSIEDTIKGLSTCDGDIPWQPDEREQKLRAALERGNSDVLAILTAA